MQNNSAEDKQKLQETSSTIDNKIISLGLFRLSGFSYESPDMFEKTIEYAEQIQEDVSTRNCWECDCLDAYFSLLSNELNVLIREYSKLWKTQGMNETHCEQIGMNVDKLARTLTNDYTEVPTVKRVMEEYAYRIHWYCDRMTTSRLFILKVILDWAQSIHERNMVELNNKGEKS